MDETTHLLDRHSADRDLRELVRGCSESLDRGDHVSSRGVAVELDQLIEFRRSGLPSRHVKHGIEQVFDVQVVMLLGGSERCQGVERVPALALA